MRLFSRTRSSRFAGKRRVLTFQSLERRRVLAASVVLPWQTEVFFDQFSGGEAKVFARGYDDFGNETPEFFGFEFCRAASCGGTPISLGGIGDTGIFGSFGAEAVFEVQGRLGLEYGVYANAGSANLLYDGTFTYDVNEGDGQSIGIDTGVDYAAGGLFTQSPTARAFVDLVLEIEGSVSGQGCFVGCTERGTLEFDVDESIALIGLNRGGNGSVEILTSPLQAAGDALFNELTGINAEVTESARDAFKAARDEARARTDADRDDARRDMQAATNKANDAATRKTDSNNRLKQNSAGKSFGGGKIIQINIGEDPSDLLGAELEVAVGVGFKSVANLSKPLGSISVTVPDIALVDTTLDDQDALSAKTRQDDDRRDIAELSLDLGAILGGGFGLGETRLDLEPLSMSFTTVSYDLDTSLRLNQEAGATPKERVRFDFADEATGNPIAVNATINGVTQNNVTFIEFNDGDDVDVSPPGVAKVAVTPSLVPVFNFTNDLGLDLDITGTLRALAFQLSAFGKSLIDTDPLLERSDPIGQFDFGSIFDTAFDVTGETIPFEPFTIGGPISDLAASGSIRGTVPVSGSLDFLTDNSPAVITVGASNAGPSVAENVQLRVDVPDDFTIDETTLPAGSQVLGQTIIINAGTVAVDSDVSFSFRATPDVVNSRTLFIFPSVESDSRDLNAFDNRTRIEAPISQARRITVVDFADRIPNGLRDAVEQANANPGRDLILLRRGNYVLESPLRITDSVDILALPGTTFTVPDERRVRVETASQTIAVELPRPNAELPGLTVAEVVAFINRRADLAFQQVGAEFERAELIEGDGSGLIPFGDDDVIRFEAAFSGGGGTAKASADIQLSGPDNNFRIIANGDLGASANGFAFEIRRVDVDRSTMLIFGGDGANEYRLRGVTIDGGNADVRFGGNGLGGGILMNDFDDHLVLDQVILRNNAAVRGGGAAILAGRATITDSIFQNNFAFGFGGGLHVNAGNVELTRTQFLGNRSAGEGGAIDNFADGNRTSFITMTDSLIVGNSASLGAGVQTITEGDGSSAIVEIAGTVIARNDGATNVEAFAFDAGPAEVRSLGGNLVDDGSVTFDKVTDRVDVPIIQVDQNDIAAATPGAAIGDLRINATPVGDVTTFDVDDPRFEVAGGRLKLRADQSIQLPSGSVIDVIVTATNDIGFRYEQPLSLRVVGPPTVPGNFVATSTSPTTIGLNWNDSDGETRYRLIQVLGDGNERVIDEFETDQTTAMLDDIELFATTTLILEASNVAGVARTAPSTVTQISPPPEMPQDVTIDVLSPTSVAIRWQASAFTDGYQVFVGDELVRSLPPNQTTATIDSLTADTEFAIRVVAVNVTGETASVAETIRTLPMLPTEPGTFRVENLGGGSVRLQWSAGDRVQEYRVFQSTGGEAFVEIAALPADRTDFLIDDLADDVRHEFQVRSVNVSGGATTLGLEGAFGLDGGVDTVVIDAVGEAITFDDFTGDVYPDLETLVIRGDRGALLVVTPESVAELTEASDNLSIVAQSQHEVTFTDGWEVADPVIQGDRFFRVLVNGSATLRLNRPDHFRNPINVFDVNGSGETSALDALVVINELGRIENNDLTEPLAGDLDRFAFFDVTGDFQVTALDALRVINQLARIRSPEGEFVSNGGIDQLDGRPESDSALGDRLNEDFDPIRLPAWRSPRIADFGDVAEERSSTIQPLAPERRDSVEAIDELFAEFSMTSRFNP